jgi:hypothetical protein
MDDGHALLHFPFSVVEGTHVSCLQPARDTMKVEGVLHVNIFRVFKDEQVSVRTCNVACSSTHITNPPGRITLFRCSGYLIGLAVDAYHGMAHDESTSTSIRAGLTEVHDMIAADRAVVDDNV